MVAKKCKWRDGRRSVAARLVQVARYFTVYEGAKTEPRYFKGMKAALGQVNGRKIAMVVRAAGSMR